MPDDIDIIDHYHVPTQHSSEESPNVTTNEMLCNIANELHTLNFLLSTTFKVAINQEEQIEDNTTPTEE